MDSLQTIGIKMITMNDSVMDNYEMMAPKAHHIQRRLTSPSTGHPENRTIGSPSEGTNGPPGSGADSFPPGQCGVNPTAVMTG